MYDAREEINLLGNKRAMCYSITRRIRFDGACVTNARPWRANPAELIEYSLAFRCIQPPDGVSSHRCVGEHRHYFRLIVRDTVHRSSC